FLIPYVFQKHAGLDVGSLAPAEFVQGRIAGYLTSIGAISTSEPNLDKTIMHSLLVGKQPWLIFPETMRIEGKCILDQPGMFNLYSDTERPSPYEAPLRPPWSRNAAAVALRAELHRRKLARLAEQPVSSELAETLERFDLSSVDEALRKRTVIVPVNIVYFPLPPQTSVFLHLAKQAIKDLSPRAIQELSAEGTVLAQDRDIDITLGDPIDVGEFLDAPEYAGLMACGDAELDRPAANPDTVFQKAAQRLMLRYMEATYSLTTLNHDHIFGGLLRHLRAGTFTEDELRSRAFLAAQRLEKIGRYRLHPRLAEHYPSLAFGGDGSELRDFLDRCLHEGLLRAADGRYIRTRRLRASAAGLETVRTRDILSVSANELEPANEAAAIVKHAAALSPEILRRRIRSHFFEEDRALFEADYAEFAIVEESKPTEVGAPFLLEPRHIRGGVVLIHGYMAAPLEVRALGEYLAEQGFVVYGVRLKGHGTAPEDLARTKWGAWRASVDRAFAVVRSYTDRVVFGGFSMGGVFALLAAAEKQADTLGAFAISAPLELRSYAARLASSVVTMNTILNRFSGRDAPWYVENDPENPHINYFRNPIAGVSELGTAMKAMESVLPDVTAPALIVQGDGDPTVHPHSAQRIFELLGSETKKLIVLHRDRHGIVNGPGSREVFEQVGHFLRSLEARPCLSEARAAG
ncbi:MAG: alpha/beta fold hydrolase, partial [Candidatus Hydrogenedentota bacterium]